MHVQHGGFRGLFMIVWSVISKSIGLKTKQNMQVNSFGTL